MPALRSLPRGLPRPTRRPPSLGRAAVLTVLALALGGCQTTDRPPSLRKLFAPAWATGSSAPAPFVDRDGTPPPSVNAEALAALTAAAAAATQAARTADEPAAAAAATQAFDAALAAKAPSPLISLDNLDQQIVAALAEGIAVGSDGYPSDSPRLQTATQATLSAAKTAGYRFDDAKAKTAIDAAVTQARAAPLARSVAAALKADPRSAADQVTAAIRQAPDLAGAIVHAALNAAPSERAAIVAAATTASAGTPGATAVAAAVNEANSAQTLRELTAALQADPANAARHLATALRQDPRKALNLVGTATQRAPAQAPAIVAAAIEAAPTQVISIIAITISLAPSQGEIIRSVALQTAERLGLPAAIIATLRHQTPTQLAAANITQAVAAATATGSVSAWVNQAAPNAQQVVSPPNSIAPTAPVMATSPGGRPSGSIGFTLQNREFATVRVLYGTDRTPLLPLPDWRKELPTKGSDFLFFGPDRDKTIKGLRYGRCFVSIPKRRVIGEMNRPGTLSRESIVEHIMLRGITELDPGSFEHELGTLTRPAPGETTGKDAFIFIHGFNVTFNQAVMRAAQMAYDFGFLGAPVVYSWSSAGSVSPQAMQHDPENVLKTCENLRKFVMQVQKHTEGNVHLVAHSMGNRALVKVLIELAKDWVDARSRIDLRPGREKLFGEIVLAAPDVPDDWFEDSDARAVKALADRVTLYVADDRALHFSKLSGNNRLGLAGPEMFIADGVQTINAAGADNDWFSLRHGYVYDVPQVMRDLQSLLVNRAKPDQHPRSLFEQKTDDKRTYWSVLKTVPEKARPAPKLK